MTSGLPKLETKLTASALAPLAADGRFSGYASLFDRVDLSRDRVRPRRLRGEPGPARRLGRPHALAARRGRADRRLAVAGGGRGRPVASGPARAGRRPRAARRGALLAEGALDGLSIGFRTEKARTDPKTGIRDLTEIDLWEISLVTFPMLPDARIAGIERRVRPDGARLAGLLRRAAGRLRSTPRNSKG